MGDDFGGEFCMPIISVDSMKSEVADISNANRVIFNSDDYYGISQKKKAFFFEAEIEDQSEVTFLLLSTLFGKRFERTLSRLNDEWLLKMWKVSEYDLMVFRFEQISKRFDKGLEAQSLMQERWDQIRKTVFVKSLV